MALIKCPKCGQQISEHAAQCIHCGYTLNSSKNYQIDSKPVNKGSKKKLIIAIIAIVLVVAVGSVGITIAIMNHSNKKNDIEVEKCKQEGCENKVYSNGYCIEHYRTADEESEKSKNTSSSNDDGSGIEEDKIEATKFSKDKTVSLDTCEFTFIGYSIAKKIEPTNVKNTSVYHYFEASTGNQFIDVKFKIKNKQSSSVDQDEILDSVKIIYDGEFEYRCQFVTVDKDNDFEQYTNLYSISPLETMEYHMLSEVPDEVKTSDKSLVVQVTADGKLYECKLR